ncbi:MAG: PEP-CTERM sorting domain-containing protein [Bryobacteraceae bacterium]
MRGLRITALLMGTCWLGMGAVTYQIPNEDGTAEGAMGPITPLGSGYLIWMNHFVVQAGGENIKQVQISYGCTSPGCQFPSPFSTPFTTFPVYLWQGTSNNPAGATLLTQTNNVTIQAGDANTNTFLTLDLNPPCCLTPGTHIFVGTVANLAAAAPGFLPAGFDLTPGSIFGESWFQLGTTAAIPNLNTLGGAYQSLADANFLIRAVGEECPEPGTVALGGLGLVAIFIGRAKRRFAGE